MNQKAQRKGFGRGENMIFIFFSFCFFLRFTKIESKFFIQTGGKVDLRNESYE